MSTAEINWEEVLRELTGCEPKVAIRLTKIVKTSEYVGPFYVDFMDQSGDIIVAFGKTKFHMGEFTLETVISEEQFHSETLEDAYKAFINYVEPLAEKSKYALTFLADKENFLTELYNSFCRVLVEGLNARKYAVKRYRCKKKLSGMPLFEQSVES